MLLYSLALIKFYHLFAISDIKYGKKDGEKQ